MFFNWIAEVFFGEYIRRNMFWLFPYGSSVKDILAIGEGGDPDFGDLSGLREGGDQQRIADLRHPLYH